MLKTIILLSFISLVVSENTTISLTRNKKCYYKRSESDKKVINLFATVRNGEKDTWEYELAECEYGLCRDWWGNEVLDYCKASKDHCEDYREGLCRGDEWKIGDWSFGQWVVWIVIIIVVYSLSYQVCVGERETGKKRVYN